MAGGLFISVEGTEGAGKSTQCAMLKDALARLGFDAILTREPGGTAVSEAIRALLLDTKTDVCARAEALLYAASRAETVERIIKPALNAQKAVICDRFIDSSIVYQGITRGLGIKEVIGANALAIDGIMPDITILLDLPPEKGFARKKNTAFDRLEMQGNAFHQAVYEGYKELAALYPERIKTVDAAKSKAEVHAEILSLITHLRRQQ